MSLYTYQEPPASLEDIQDYLREQLSSIESSLNDSLKFNASQFLDKKSSVNTRFKREGVPVWDYTTKRPVWPTGNGETDPWIYGDGAVAYSPT